MTKLNKMVETLHQDHDAARAPQIRLKNLSVDYPGRSAVLRGITLNIMAGERVAIIGPSGAGKSTLLKVINGLIPPASGSLEISLELDAHRTNRQIPSDASDEDVRRSRIAMIFQEYALANRLSVLTNVLIGSLGRTSTLKGFFGVFDDEDRRLAKSLLKAVGLEHLQNKRVDALSSGEKQRVAIARALMQERHILLADEPVASLDMRTSESIMALLIALQAEMGFTLLMSLHDIEHARKYCDRAIGIRNGMIVYDGSSLALNDGVLEKIFGT